MNLHKFWAIRENQKGFTMIEVIAVTLITGLLGIGVAMASTQVVKQGASNSDYTTASRHTMNAIYWVSRDAQMSQTLEPGEESGFPLILGWTEWDNSEHQVVYSVSEDNNLRRSYSINGGEQRQTVVAQYINSVSENTTCEVNGDNLTLKVTCTVGTGSNAVSVTKEREITPRPDL